MTAPTANLLLNSLSSKNRDLLLLNAKVVDLPAPTVLYEPDQTPRYAYFMTSGIASIVTSMPEGSTAEVGIIGREGVVGSLHLLGPAPVQTRCYVQVPGTALRIPFEDLHKTFLSSDGIRQRALEFVQEEALSLSQIAGCNRLHEAEERLARWLLMVVDRVETGNGAVTIPITQEVLAVMLGSRRTTVTLAAGVLQRSGLIDCSRGHIHILDRQRLEEAACDCYGVTKKLLNNLYNHR
jgi:CRP-like cAMP-binding protein